MSRFRSVCTGLVVLCLGAGLTVVAGGVGTATTSTEARELPGRWVRTSSLVFRDSGPVITMRNGRVLSVGGCGRKVQVFHPAGNRWKEAEPTGVPMCDPMLARLPKGRVLAFGGLRFFGNGDVRRTRAAVVYHPRAHRWTRTGSLHTARNEGAVARLPHGRILVAGGYGPHLCIPMNSVEIYHPRNERWTRTASLDRARGGAQAAVLPDGDVLVMGGSRCGGALASVERYDMRGQKWEPAQRLPRPGTPAVATLANGRIMAVGLNRRNDEARAVAVFRPRHKDWRVVDPIPGHLWYPPPMTLHHGRPLIAGGTGSGECRSSAFRYAVRTGKWRRVQALPSPRCTVLLAALKDGTVLAVGGLDFIEGGTGHQLKTSMRFSLHD
jgi:hypothetical protein